MGKKKSQQNSDTPVYETSVQVEAISEKDEVDVKSCPHIAKSVDTNHIRKKVLKRSEFIVKTPYVACAVHSASRPPTDKSWLCLKCGTLICCLDHAVEHQQTPRSTAHDLTLDFATFTVWCHVCKKTIPESKIIRLRSCISGLRQMMESIPQHQVSVIDRNCEDDVPPPLLDLSQNESLGPAVSKIRRKLPKTPPIVPGLQNLGNTCFLNSVLQCLARTPNLVKTLRSLETEDQEVKIPLKEGGELSGKLESSFNQLGSCLADTLEELCNSRRCIAPSKLLDLLRKRCPQFEGCGQHDAHEFLRNLLDNVRSSDLKRYKYLILIHKGLTRKVRPEDVSEEVQKNLKALHNEVMEKVTLVPDHVFKGMLVSTLECQECLNRSYCVESFSDLSLPIIAEKPQPPSLIKRTVNASTENSDDKGYSGTMSKYQMKKERQARKKNRKQLKKFQNLQENSVDGSKEETIDEPPSDGDSDADVEDNEETDKRHESGYSSEKAQSESGGSSLSGPCGEDSARTSPDVKEDAALSVCEGFPLVRDLPSWLATRTNIATWSSENERVMRIAYEMQHGSDTPPSPQCRLRKVVAHPDPTWLAQGNVSLNNLLLSKPHLTNCETFIDDPEHIMSLNDQWKKSLPREGDLPNTVTYKKRALINNPMSAITEEENEVKKGTEDESIPDLIPVENATDNENVPNDSEHSANKTEMSESVGQAQMVSKLAEDILSEVSGLQMNWMQSSSVDTVFTSECTAEPCNINSLNYSEKDKNCPDQDAAESPDSDRVIDYFRRNLNLSRPINSIKNDASIEESEKVALEKDPIENDSLKNVNIVIESDNIYVKSKKADDNFSRSSCLEDSLIRKNPHYGDEEECSIQSCLNQFITTEIMSGSNKVGCSACTAKLNKGNKEGKTVYTIALKKFLIKEAPEVLVLHLKRFQVQMYSFKKLTRHVSFPLTLDLAPFCVPELQQSSDDNKLLYSLYGVVEHSGNMRGGHYVAYIKVVDDEGESSWFCISDSLVHRVQESCVLTSQAYLLFYSRTKTS